MAYATEKEARGALKRYVNSNPSIAIFCKDNFFKISCPEECLWYNKCRSFDYTTPRLMRRLYKGRETLSLYPSDYYEDK